MDQHECQAPEAPTDLRDRWKCPVCARVWNAFDAGRDWPQARMPAGTLGWTTRPMVER